MRSSPAGAAAGQNNYSITIIVKDDASLCAPAPHRSHFYRTIHRGYRTLTITNVHVLYILSNWLCSITLSTASAELWLCPCDVLHGRRRLAVATCCRYNTIVHYLFCYILAPGHHLLLDQHRRTSAAVDNRAKHLLSSMHVRI